MQVHGMDLGLGGWACGQEGGDVGFDPLYPPLRKNVADCLRLWQIFRSYWHESGWRIAEFESVAPARHSQTHMQKVVESHTDPGMLKSVQTKQQGSGVGARNHLLRKLLPVPCSKIKDVRFDEESQSVIVIVAMRGKARQYAEDVARGAPSTTLREIRRDGGTWTWQGVTRGAGIPLVFVLGPRHSPRTDSNSDKLARAKKAIKEKNLTWRSCQNKPEGAKSAISDAWSIKGWPTIVILDERMRIRCRGHSGKKATAVARDLLAALEAKESKR